MVCVTGARASHFVSLIPDMMRMGCGGMSSSGGVSRIGPTQTGAAKAAGTNGLTSIELGEHRPLQNLHFSSIFSLMVGCRWGMTITTTRVAVGNRRISFGVVPLPRKRIARSVGISG